MDELIYKRDAIKAICEDGTWLESQGCTEITMAERKQRDVDIIEDLPPVQLGTNLAEVGTDLVSKRAAIDALTTYIYNVYKVVVGKTLPAEDCKDAAESVIDELPTLEIIRCKDCKHWNLQVGNVKGDGLGSCDFHNVNLVTGEGFCYWAERRTDE